MCPKCKTQERAHIAAALAERDRHLAHLHQEVRLLWLTVAALGLLLAMCAR